MMGLSGTQVEGIAGGMALRVVEVDSGREGTAVRVSGPWSDQEFIIVEWDGRLASTSYVKRERLEVVG